MSASSQEPATIRIEYSGRNYDQMDDLPDRMELGDTTTLQETLAIRVNGHSLIDRLPPSCLLVVNDQHAGTVAEPDDVTLHHGDELLVIAPVAGG